MCLILKRLECNSSNVSESNTKDAAEINKAFVCWHFGGGK